MGKGAVSGDFTDAGYQPAGIYGWRKQCLYATVLFILVVVILNLAFTVWILRVLDFSIDGLHTGRVKLTPDGVLVDGDAEVVKALYASNIVAKKVGHDLCHFEKKDMPLHIQSSRDILLQARGTDDQVHTAFHIGKNKIEASCDRFEVKGPGGRSRFKVTDKEVTYGIDEVTYSGKSVFLGSVETPNIRGPYAGSLRLESISSSILMVGRKRIGLEAPEGDISMKSSQNIAFKSHRKIVFNSTNLYLKNMEISPPNRLGKSYDDVYQLCMCQNGRLFLAASNADCITESEMCTS